VADHVSTEPPVTRDEHGNPTSVPEPKVVAATGGAVVGAAAGFVLVYVIETAARIDMPTLVDNAIITLVAAAVTFVGGYVKHPRG
jgi:NhaP-type Na+/H+ or K+/H+ antiporter